MFGEFRWSDDAMEVLRRKPMGKSDKPPAQVQKNRQEIFEKSMEKIEGQRLGNSRFCAHQTIQNRSSGSFKINPGGSQGHQKSFSGALRARNWTVRAQQGTFFDTRKAILTLLGLILEFLARILAALEADLGAPVFHFEGPGALRGSILSILQQFCRIYENHGKTQVFS